MDKRFLGRIFVPLVILAAAVLWLLSVIPETASTFSWFSLSWAMLGVSGALAVKYIVSGLFGNDVVVNKAQIYVGFMFLTLTLFFLTWAIVVPEDIIAPIIGIFVAAAIFCSIFFTGGKSWDTADNQKVGYKNYHQRKAEEAKEEAKKNKN